MKVSYQFLADSLQERVIYTLMQRASFREIERIVINTQTDNPHIYATFEGYGQTFDALSKTVYIEIRDEVKPDNLIPGYTFYGYKFTDGFKGDMKDLKRYMAKINTSVLLEIKYLPNENDK